MGRHYNVSCCIVAAVSVVCPYFFVGHQQDGFRIVGGDISSFPVVADAFAPPPTFPSRRHSVHNNEGMISQQLLDKNENLIMISSRHKRYNIIRNASYARMTHHVLASSTTSGDVGHAGKKHNKPTLINTQQKDLIATSAGFDSIVNKRYACTRFQRYQEPLFNSHHDAEVSEIAKVQTTTKVLHASLSDPTVIKAAHECLQLAQRAPTGFNAQPYRVILVHSKEGKERLSQYCLGRNADRVRDSDCTVVFLADKECGRDGTRFANFLIDNMDPPLPSKEDGDSDTTSNTSRTRRPLSSRALFKLRMLIMLFSSGYPIPRFLNVPFSFGVRSAMSILAFLARCLQSMRLRFRILSKLIPTDIQMFPTLTSAETWAQKNTMLVAMTFMLACTSKNLSTCPMEGIDAAGVRKVLGIPRGRFSIPLIVSTGTPYRRSVNESSETDDVGLSHGDDGNFSPRYNVEEVVYGNSFGSPCDLA